MRVDVVGGRRTLFVMATDHEYGPALRARIDPLITGVGVVDAGAGSTVTLTATPLGVTFAFAGWSGATCTGSKSANVVTFTGPSADADCVASFTIAPPLP